MKIKITLIVLVFFLNVGYMSGQGSGRKITITGSVSDDRMKPVTNAIILIDNESTDVVTDNKGHFKIKVSPDADTLTIVTLTNFIVNEPINGRTHFNFTVSNSASQKSVSHDNALKDNEPASGYSDDNTKKYQMEGRSNKYYTYSSIYQILKETPGIIVSGNSVRIQGAASFALSTEPLYVVDGIIVGSIDYIEPKTVRNIKVLKGPAAAIYGSRGSNGVITINLIKTSEMK